MPKSRRIKLTLTGASVGLLTALAVAAPASAGIKNGGFETGNFSQWATTAEEGTGIRDPFVEWRVYTNDQRVLPDGPPLPLGGATLPAPIGKYSSVLVQADPSNGSLSQSFRVGKRARYLSLKTFWLNQACDRPPAPASAGASPRGVQCQLWPFTGSFDVACCPPTAGNQYFSIDLVRANASALATDEAETLASGYAPNSATDADSGGWQKVRIPLKGLRGKRVKLRLAAVDNEYFLNVGLDAVRVVNARKPKPVTG